VIDHLDTGGAQVILLRLLENTNHAAWQPHVCCLHGNGFYAERLYSLGVPVHNLAQQRWDLGIPYRLAKTLRTLQPDIVHLHLEMSTFLGVFLARALTKALIVVSIYGLRNQYPFWVFPLLKTLGPWIDAYVVGGRALESELKAASFTPSKLHFISLVATELAGDLGNVEVIRSAARQTEGLGPDSPVVLRIARLHPQKGYLLLLSAMARVVQACPTARLLIVGDGPQERELYQRVDSLGLTDAVRFLGFRPALRDLYLASDIVVISSQREGVGLTTVEAMACGRPVVACAVGGIAGFIRHGETGLVVPPNDPDALADALITLLRDEESRRRLGAAARAIIQQEHPLAHMVAEHERLYRDLLNAGRR
jgi:glycosyltransferase involved in cell wall biosynthesis